MLNIIQYEAGWCIRSESSNHLAYYIDTRVKVAYNTIKLGVSRRIILDYNCECTSYEYMKKDRTCAVQGPSARQRRLTN
jgi:hypothetical protein